MTKRYKKGFTLIEIVVAAMILSAATITIGAICNKCVRSVKLSQEHEIAWEVLDKQLNIIDYLGLKTFIDADRMAGEIDENEMKYHWQLKLEQRDIDGLYDVDISVSWLNGKAGHMISASTMLFDKKAKEE